MALGYSLSELWEGTQGVSQALSATVDIEGRSIEWGLVDGAVSRECADGTLSHDGKIKNSCMMNVKLINSFDACSTRGNFNSINITNMSIMPELEIVTHSLMGQHQSMAGVNEVLDVLDPPSWYVDSGSISYLLEDARFVNECLNTGMIDSFPSSDNGVIESGLSITTLTDNQVRYESGGFCCEVNERISHGDDLPLAIIDYNPYVIGVEDSHKTVPVMEVSILTPQSKTFDPGIGLKRSADEAFLSNQN